LNLYSPDPSTSCAIHRESDTRDIAFEETYDGVWKSKTIVWVGRLENPVNNHLLQNPNFKISHDSGEFSPYPTFVEFNDKHDDWELKGHKLFLTFQLPIEDTFKTCLEEAAAPAATESKTEYDAKKAERDALLKKKNDRKKKGP
jgi:hypothetical protein